MTRGQGCDLFNACVPLRLTVARSQCTHASDLGVMASPMQVTELIGNATRARVEQSAALDIALTRRILQAHVGDRGAVWTANGIHREKAVTMNRLDVGHRPHADQARAKPRIEMVMPRLTQEQMLAILREGGVPESDARRWVEREAKLARDMAAGES
jgi:hypothetical protein